MLYAPGPKLQAVAIFGQKQNMLIVCRFSAALTQTFQLRLDAFSLEIWIWGNFVGKTNDDINTNHRLFLGICRYIGI